MFWFYLALVLGVDFVAITCAKKYVENHESSFLIAAIAGYALMGFLVIQMLRHEGFTIANVIWSGAWVVISVLIGFFIFGEKISWLQAAGIIIIFLGILLTQWPTK